jgi:hypothetical protein
VPGLWEEGARFRIEIVTGVGGKQILVQGPAGQPGRALEQLILEAQLSQPS